MRLAVAACAFGALHRRRRRGTTRVRSHCPRAAARYQRDDVVILISGSPPARVSLYGSPTVSPVTAPVRVGDLAAEWQSRCTFRVVPRTAPWSSRCEKCRTSSPSARAEAPADRAACDRDGTSRQKRGNDHFADRRPGHMSTRRRTRVRGLPDAGISLNGAAPRSHRAAARRRRHRLAPREGVNRDEGPMITMCRQLERSRGPRSERRR